MDDSILLCGKSEKHTTRVQNPDSPQIRPRKRQRAACRRHHTAFQGLDGLGDSDPEHRWSQQMARRGWSDLARDDVPTRCGSRRVAMCGDSRC